MTTLVSASFLATKVCPSLNPSLSQSRSTYPCSIVSLFCPCSHFHLNPPSPAPIPLPATPSHLLHQPTCHGPPKKIRRHAWEGPASVQLSRLVKGSERGLKLKMERMVTSCMIWVPFTSFILSHLHHAFVLLRQWAPSSQPVSYPSAHHTNLAKSSASRAFRPHAATLLRERDSHRRLGWFVFKERAPMAQSGGQFRLAHLTCAGLGVLVCLCHSRAS